MASDAHGGTTAAWTAVVIIVAGCVVSAVALPLASPTLFFVGVAVIILGALVGKVMSMMGQGQTVAYKDRHDPDYDEESKSSPSAVQPDGEQEIEQPVDPLANQPTGEKKP